MQKLKVGDTVQVTAGAERTQKSNRGKILAFDKVKVTYTPQSAKGAKGGGAVLFETDTAAPST